MSKKYYVIRAIAYHYSDEYLYSIGLGGIEAVFEDKEIATQKHRALELNRLRGLGIGDMEQTSSCANSSDDLQKAEDFFQANFNKPLFVQSGEHRYIETDTGFPRDASDEQMLAFAELTGIKFFELTEFENEPVFWIPRKRLDNGDYEAPFTHFEMPKGKEIWECYQEVGMPPQYYNTYEAAMQTILSEYNARYAPKKVTLGLGNLEQLTEQPDLLSHLTETTSNIVFENNELSITKDITLEELNLLMGLLKNPPYLIQSVRLSQVEQIPHGIYEMM